MSALSIEHLSIGLPQGADRAFAVEDISFAIEKGEILCVVGESGSGKSMTANALMGLLPPGVTVKSGRARRWLPDLSKVDLRSCTGTARGYLVRYLERADQRYLC